MAIHRKHRTGKLKLTTRCWFGYCVPKATLVPVVPWRGYFPQQGPWHILPSPGTCQAPRILKGFGLVLKSEYSHLICQRVQLFQYSKINLSISSCPKVYENPIPCETLVQLNMGILIKKIMEDTYPTPPAQHRPQGPSQN